eukprot:TRINITY_DN104406_c0_g1_i1.p1 TRINITY_DN104406_c0_g1~~TRINITY_DN104406_c0_g1_i1.p1  ORF type:complete len:233 (-),score=27.18 TRINITY_DN104406_c0_g1_i1:46-744(-)
MGSSGSSSCCFTFLTPQSNQGQASSESAASKLPEASQAPSPESAPPPAPRPSEPPLPLQPRIAARQNDAKSLEIYNKTLKKSIAGLDEQGRPLLFYAVRGNRDDGGKAQPTLPMSVATMPSTGGPGQGFGDVVQYLVQNHGVDVNYQVEGTGVSPLMEAARFGSIQSVVTLLALRANPDLRDSQGHTALDIAKMKLPSYLEFQEIQCSENCLDGVSCRINEDRLQVARLLHK